MLLICTLLVFIATPRYLILIQLLPPSYKSFVMNFNMQGMEMTIPEVYSMLKSAEVEIKKEHQVLIVNKTTSFKKGKGKKNFKKDGN